VEEALKDTTITSNRLRIVQKKSMHGKLPSIICVEDCLSSGAFKSSSALIAPQNPRISTNFTQVMPVDDTEVINEIEESLKKQETKTGLKRGEDAVTNCDSFTDSSIKKVSNTKKTAGSSPKKVSLYRPNYLSSRDHGTS